MSHLEIEEQHLCDMSIAATEATGNLMENQETSLALSLAQREQGQPQLRSQPKQPKSSAAWEFNLSLFHICWDDILIPKILSRLELKDLFNLRCCSKLCKELAESTLAIYKDIHLSGNNSPNIHLAFAVLGKVCKHVKSIQLANCQWLNDTLLLPILTNNIRLQVVNLNECLNITPRGLQPLILNCKELRVLKLSKCSWLSVGTIEALTLHHSNLEEVDISYCFNIGERCLSLFFRKLNKLKILCLAHTRSVTDDVLIEISNYCPLLEHINVAGCVSITDFGVIPLTAQCKKLQSLMIRDCMLVTEHALEPIKDRIAIDRPLHINNFFYLADIFHRP